MPILSPTSSATFQVSYLERRLSTAGPGTGQSKSSLKDWMQYLSRISPNVDASSMSRVLTSLHVDLPRNLPEVRRLLPNISFSELQQIVLRNQRRREKVPTNSAGRDNTNQSAVTDVKRTCLHDSAELQHEEQTVSDNVTNASDNDSSKTCAASVQLHVVSESATAEKSSIQTSTSSVPVTDSVVSRFNTVASGIAKHIAEYMPTVDVPVNTTAVRTKSPEHLEQKQESCKTDSKEIVKPSVVKKETSALKKQPTVRRQLVTRGSIDRQTRGLVLCLRDARTSTSQLVRLQELCQHISQYPDCTGIAVKVCSLMIPFVL